MDNFIYKKKWFSSALPTNFAKAKLTLGTGTNGVLTITADNIGIEGNDYTVTVSDAGLSGCNMSATLSGKDITITLGKTVDTLEPTKNTVILISVAVAALNGVTATKSGTGADSLVAAVATTNLASGSYATPSKEKYSMVFATPYYYLNTKIGSKYTAEWQRFTPATY